MGQKPKMMLVGVTAKPLSFGAGPLWVPFTLRASPSRQAEARLWKPQLARCPGSLSPRLASPEGCPLTPRALEASSRERALGATAFPASQSVLTPPNCPSMPLLRLPLPPRPSPRVSCSIHCVLSGACSPQRPHPQIPCRLCSGRRPPSAPVPPRLRHLCPTGPGLEGLE